MKQEVSNKITYYNWFMALAIVFYHWHDQFMDVTRFNQPQPMTEEVANHYIHFFNNIGGVAVSYFFILSGLLLYRNVDARTIGKKLKKRAYSLLVPFVLWNAIVVVYTFVMFRTVCFSSLKQLVLGFSLEPFDGPLWHMFALMLITLLSPVLLKLKDNRVIATVLFAIIICASSVFRHTIALDVLGNLRFGTYLYRLIGYFPMYFLGAYVGMYHDEKVLEEKYNYKVISILAIVIACVCAVLFWHLGDEGIIPVIAQRIQAICLWLMIPSLFFKWKPAMPFKTSLYIYAMHQPILIPLTNSWITSAWMDGVYSLGGHIFLSFASVIVLFLLCMIMIYGMKFLLRESVFAALSGGRV